MVKKQLSFLLAATLLAAAGCGQNPGAPDAAQQEAKAKIVELYTVEKQTKPIMLAVTGMVEAKQEASLAFGTSGKITQITVKKGDQVAAGQLLASLDAGYYQKALEAAAGQVREAATRKQVTVNGAKPEEIQQQRLQVEAADKRYEKAKQDRLKGEKLYEGGAISKAALDDLRLQEEQAEIASKNEHIRLDDMLKGADADDLAAVDASLQLASSEAERARKTLGDTKVVAPFAGTVVDVTQQVGELSGPGQALIHLVDLSTVKVTVDVASDLIDQFREGEEVTVSRDGQNKTAGRITYISPVIDQQTGKYRVEVTVPNHDRAWRGGMLATVEVPRQIKGLVVPMESVGISQSDRYVLVVENGVAKKRVVTIGQVLDDKIEVLSGLKAGDKVVRTGITYIIDGEKVAAKGE
ncbi:efflux RND transporter periplasmic adaptor subunit [Brevibacillus sp. SYP-B805]|uniref:efflux RND transporter periplasmic adaptor subunit n=1 Tax=Brevibacillus sp. SYP-B805 TaxID=1578199 RepID=UPI0019D1C534|nr:efflux RND transporter periplasmic adaptor subunit [Brevibacillus sp. SYP-B805]